MSKTSKGIGVILSVLIHAGIIALLFFGLSSHQSQPDVDTAVLPETIEATAVDESLLDAEVNKLRTAELEKKQAEDNRQQRLEDKAHAEELRLKKAKRQRREEEEKAQKESKIQQQKQREREQKRLQETEQLAQLKQQQAQLKKQQEAEKKELERIQQAKVEAEKKRKAEEQRLKEQADKRIAEAKKREQDKQRKQALAQKKREEAERLEQAKQDLKRRLAEESKQRATNHRRKQNAIQKTKRTISDKVERYWVRPTTVDKQLKCIIRIRMMPDGEVISAQVIKSSGNPTFDRSAETAVRKASPLPVPRELFQDFKISDFPFSPS